MKKAIKFFEEEITRLKNAPKINGCEMTEEWAEQIEICKIAKSAIEKQIPRRAIMKGFNPCEEICSVSYLCPICKKHINIDKYCYHCGQAIDWSDTE